jgi:3',5'-cyclic AMP phosphodiesterase CpdA
MILAQITDLHVSAKGAPFDVANHTAQRLARAVKHLRRLRPRPDAVICTGDLVNEGSPREYARLLQLLRPLPMPWYVLPGNHDDRDHLRAALAGVGYLPRRGPLHYDVPLGPLRLIALDTLVPGAPGGRLGEQQLRWLDGRLARAGKRNTVLAMHHPPFRTGIEAMDAMGLEDAPALAEMVARYPGVERILCGHLHRAITRRFAGTVASTCPSTAPQVALDLTPGAPVSLVSEPIACQLHLWTDGGLVTHTSFV